MAAWNLESALISVAHSHSPPMPETLPWTARHRSQSGARVINSTKACCGETCQGPALAGWHAGQKLESNNRHCTRCAFLWLWRPLTLRENRSQPVAPVTCLLQGASSCPPIKPSFTDDNLSDCQDTALAYSRWLAAALHLHDHVTSGSVPARASG